MRDQFRKSQDSADSWRVPFGRDGRAGGAGAGAAAAAGTNPNPKLENHPPVVPEQQPQEQQPQEEEEEAAQGQQQQAAAAGSSSSSSSSHWKMQGPLLRILVQAAFVGVLVYSLKGAPQLPARLASPLLSRATLAGTTLDDFEGDVLDKIRSQLDFRAWLQHEAPPYQTHIKSALTLYLLFYMLRVWLPLPARGGRRRAPAPPPPRPPPPPPPPTPPPHPPPRPYPPTPHRHHHRNTPPPPRAAERVSSLPCLSDCRSRRCRRWCTPSRSSTSGSSASAPC